MEFSKGGRQGAEAPKPKTARINQANVGVGTVAKACSEMNRDNISYEIDEKYYKILLTMIKEYNKIEST